MTRARITILNDNPEFLELMSELLDGRDYETVALEAETTNADELAATTPDLLIIDLRLGSGEAFMTGWELVLVAKMHPVLKSVPVILCTGDAQFIRERGDEIRRAAGVHPILKPFRLDEMETLIARLLGAPEPAQA